MSGKGSAAGQGRVWLVGAGPGSPDLLTIRAVRALAQADLLLYDALVAKETLDVAPNAQRFCVGKRGGRPSMDQETIHRLMIRGARRGKRVVRLKGGDPFVFGRGGEEALALAAAGIPCEVVPGVSNALAAPALAGIPVTHRGLASAFVVVSGHAESAYRPVLEPLAPQSLTVVVLMGLASRARVARLLLGRGWSPSTPAAILFAAGREDAHTWRGTLDTLDTAAPPDALADAPGTIVIGDVVSLADVIAVPSAADAAAETAFEGGQHARRG
jgi:uroporphyrin-III C-methyltransferase / precorrin-2 dehydrogenase / sirohydrochlorin ferrochelatase